MDPGVRDPGRLRRVLGAFATGVTVVTVGGDTPHAMTANSFTSVSLDPPLVAVCVERAAVMHGCLHGARGFAVSVLAHRQRGLARHFADRNRPLGMAQFAGVAWSVGPATGAPLLAGALAHFECQVWRRYDGGDHTIVVGRLLGVSEPAEDEPLLFVNSGFARPATAEAGI